MLAEVLARENGAGRLPAARCTCGPAAGGVGAGWALGRVPRVASAGPVPAVPVDCRAAHAARLARRAAAARGRRRTRRRVSDFWPHGVANWQCGMDRLSCQAGRMLGGCGPWVPCTTYYGNEFFFMMIDRDSD